jgi:hypothetical protein
MLLTTILYKQQLQKKRGKRKSETNLRVVLPLPVSPTMISVSFFLTSSTSLFCTEPITNNKFQLPELTTQTIIRVNRHLKLGRQTRRNRERLPLLPNLLPPPAQANQKAKAQSSGQRIETIGSRDKMASRRQRAAPLVGLLLVRGGARIEGRHLGRLLRSRRPETCHGSGRGTHDSPAGTSTPAAEGEGRREGGFGEGRVFGVVGLQASGSTHGLARAGDDEAERRRRCLKNRRRLKNPAPVTWGLDDGEPAERP